MYSLGLLGSIRKPRVISDLLLHVSVYNNRSVIISAANSSLAPLAPVVAFRDVVNVNSERELLRAQTFSRLRRPLCEGSLQRWKLRLLLFASCDAVYNKQNASSLRD